MELSTIELAETIILTDEKITANELLALHFDNMDQNRCLSDHSIITIMEIFGGADNVLNILLSSHTHDLDNIKLHQLQQILQLTSEESATEIITTSEIMATSPTIRQSVISPTIRQSVISRQSGINRPSVVVLAEMYRNIMMNELRINDQDDDNKTTTTTKTRKKRSGTIHDSDKPIEWKYCFARNNTFIHSIFGQIKGQKVFDILYSKYVIFIVFMLLFLIPFGFENIKQVPTNDYIRYIYFSVIVPIQILYFIFHVLSVNKKCFFLMIKRFEFFFKLVYGIQFVIGSFFYWQLPVGTAVLIGTITFLAIMLLSLSDGLQLKRWMKILFGGSVSTYYTIVAVYFFLYHYSNQDDQNQTGTIDNNDMIIKIGKNISISLVGILSQSSQILALFFWYVIIRFLSLHIMHLKYK